MGTQEVDLSEIEDETLTQAQVIAENSSKKVELLINKTKTKTLEVKNPLTDKTEKAKVKDDLTNNIKSKEDKPLCHFYKNGKCKRGPDVSTTLPSAKNSDNLE